MAACGADTTLPSEDVRDYQPTPAVSGEAKIVAWTAAQQDGPKTRHIPLSSISGGRPLSVDGEGEAEVRRATEVATTIAGKLSAYPTTQANISRDQVMQDPTTGQPVTVSFTTDDKGRLHTMRMMDGTGTGFVMEALYQGDEQDVREVRLLASDDAQVVATVAIEWPEGYVTPTNGASAEAEGEGGGEEGDMEGVSPACYIAIIGGGGLFLWALIKTMIKAAAAGGPTTPTGIFVLLGDVIALGLLGATTAWAIAEACATSPGGGSGGTALLDTPEYSSGTTKRGFSLWNAPIGRATAFAVGS